jgi:hypothetical protein
MNDADRERRLPASTVWPRSPKRKRNFDDAITKFRPGVHVYKNVYLMPWTNKSVLVLGNMLQPNLMLGSGLTRKHKTRVYRNKQKNQGSINNCPNKLRRLDFQFPTTFIRML